MRNVAQKVSEIPCITQGEHKILGEGKNNVFSFNIKKVSPIRLICIGMRLWWQFKQKRFPHLIKARKT